MLEAREFRDRADGDLRRTFGDELHVGPGAQGDIERACCHRLHDLRAAREIELFDREPVLGENTHFHANIERNEAGILDHRLADAQRLTGRPRRRQTKRGKRARQRG